jgi:hypothetical protein
VEVCFATLKRAYGVGRTRASTLVGLATMIAGKGCLGVSLKGHQSMIESFAKPGGTQELVVVCVHAPPPADQ